LAKQYDLLCFLHNSFKDTKGYISFGNSRMNFFSSNN
jgi:hypothetical protein